MSTRTRLIVGIDYGTTYSGICFVHSGATSFSDIKPFTAWPGGPREHNEHLEKVPSTFAYAHENAGKIQEDTWGYMVTPDLKSCSWTKLLLDRNALPTEHDSPALLDYDDPVHLETVSQGLMRVPQGMKAEQVVADYLGALYQMLLKTIVNKLGGEDILRVTPMEFWLTIPAIWSDAAKDTTLSAAKAAGFGSRAGDEINLISEPEAAAQLSLRSGIRTVSSIVQEKTGLLVLDCGGGTVDITSYTIDQAYPTLKLTESCVGTGGKCGGTYIDRNLHALLIKRYGSAFRNLPSERIGPGSRFMREFESEKRNFGSLGRNIRDIKLRLIIPEFSEGAEKIHGYDAEYGEVILSHDDMKSCFDPITRNILQLVSQQVEDVSKAKKTRVKTIVLVGGLGASPYIHQKLQEWCDTRSIRLVYPWVGSWSAVVCGAVLRGLEGSMVHKKLCRRSYAQMLSTEYQSGNRKQKMRLRDKWTNHFSKKTMVPGALFWRINKGDELDETTEASFDFLQYFTEGAKMFTTLKIYASSLDVAPETEDDPGVEVVGEVKAYYGGVNLSEVPFCRDENGNKQYRLDLQMKIKMNAKEGTLLFRTTTKDGLDCGEAVIEFNNENQGQTIAY